MPKVIKVWSRNRNLKKAIILRDPSDLVLHNIISKGNEKLNINGSRLVLEKDGTEVEDDELLEAFHAQGDIFILLQDNESWQSPVVNEVVLEATEDSENIDAESKSQEEDVATNSSTDDLLPGKKDNETNDATHDEANSASQRIKPICKRRSFEAEWSEFKFDWNRCARSKIQRLEDQENDKKLTSYFVNEAVDQLRDIKMSIPLAAFERAAEQLVTAYPDSFQDRNARGEKMGSGYFTLTQKMKGRHSNEHRTASRLSLSESLGMPVSKISLMSMAQAGCLNWQPTLKYSTNVLEGKRLSLKKWLIGPENTEQQNLEESNYMDKTIADKENIAPSATNNDMGRVITTPPEKNVSIEDQLTEEQKSQRLETHFVETFGYQRKFLNNLSFPPSASDIIHAWPIFLNLTFYFDHYEILMGHTLGRLETEIKQSEKKIFAYGHCKNKSSSDTISDAETIRIIGNVLKEDFNSLFPKFPGIKDPKELNAPPNTFGWVASIDNQDTYNFFLEDVLVTSDCSFITALQLLFGSFFIFNKPFPKSNSKTLDFIQRYFMDIFPDIGNKATDGARSKKICLSLSNKLSKVRLLENTDPDEE